MQSIESQFVIGPSNRLIAGVSVCTFKPGNFTRCGSEGVKYWLKLLMQTDNFNSRKAYKMLLALHNRGKTSRVSHVKLVLYTSGFEQVWLFGCGNVKPFIKELEERLCSSFCHRWSNHLDTSERLSVYNIYKHCF